MAGIIRSISNRLTKRKQRQSYRENQIIQGRKPSEIECLVEHLDLQVSCFFLQESDLSQILYDRIYTAFELKDEKEYFGLQFIDENKYKQWLDPRKTIDSQMDSGPPFSLQFRVKYFPSDPTKITDEMIRFYFVCQIKLDMRCGSFVCDSLKRSAQLAALVVQSEEGDFNPDLHDLHFISSYRFLPDHLQHETFEIEVYDAYKSSRKGITPAALDKRFLEIAMQMQDYGVEKHKVIGKDDDEYTLGLHRHGIYIYQQTDLIGLFLWENIRVLALNKKVLNINGVVKQNNGSETVYVFRFTLPTKRACKSLWRTAKEFHCFYRLLQPPAPPNQFQRLFRVNSAFHTSIRNTEKNLAQRQFSRGAFGSSCESRKFQRTPSKRFEGRASFREAPSSAAGPATPHRASGPAAASSTLLDRNVLVNLRRPITSPLTSSTPLAAAANHQLARR